MFLEVNKILKRYGSKSILNDVSFVLPAHRTLSILGKSGCGKSTLLKIISGIELQDEGLILLQGKNISSLSYNQRNIVYLF